MATNARRRWLGWLLSLVVLQPLLAQVDPRLNTNTDLLDVYTRATTAAKPEVLMVYDFSTSMLSVAWHPAYLGSTKGANNSHSPAWGQTGDADGLVPLIRKVAWRDSSNNARFSYDIVFARGKGYPLDSPDFSSIGVGADNSKVNLVGGQLVSADGTLVSWPSDTTNASRSDLVDLLTGGINSSWNQSVVNTRGATHVRITRNYDVTNAASASRTIDIPLPWTMFDSPGTVSATASNYLTSRMTLPSTSDIFNPGQVIYYDTVTQNGTNGSPYTSMTGIANNDARFQTALWDGSWSATSGNVTTTYYKIGLFHYNADYLWWVFFGTDVKNTSGTASVDQGAGNYVIPAASAGTSPWANGLPVLTRANMLKRAVCDVVKSTYDEVWWGFRFLDMEGDTGGTTYGLGSSTDYSTSNTAGPNASSPEPGRKLELLSFSASSKYKFDGLVTLAGKMPLRPQTPLTYAAGNSFAQMTETSSNNAFSNQRTDPSILPCRKSFVVFFTDGAADEPTLASGMDTYGLPYTGTRTGAAGDSVTTLLSLVPGAANFNIWTLAGTAAFGHNPPGNPAGKTNLSDGIPFWVTARPAGAPRKIRTMTIGMNLSGTLDLANPVVNSTLAADARSKWDLYRAALYGNPDAPGWGPTMPKPYNWQNDASNRNPKNNPFFFDTQSSVELTNALNDVVNEVLRVSSEISAPATPLVGFSLGKEVYLGVFQSQSVPRWNGDLLMAQIVVNTDNTVSFKDINGSVTSTITSSNAIWSAKNNLVAAGWNARRLFTYTGSSNPSSSQNLTDFTTSLAPTTFGLLSSDTATRDSVVRFMRGANAEAQTDGTKTGAAYTRSDIMGDIINSSPAALEYDLSLVPAGASDLADFKNAHSTESSLRFRVIFVGTNQGVLHAFGEVSYVNSSGTVQAKEQELWAFVPPDFLTGLPAFQTSTGNFSSHRFLVDGSPLLYFKDLPSVDGSGNLTSTRGDGKVNGVDKALVIFGLGKGGRSLYALNVDASHVFAPALQWQLKPSTPTSSDTGNTVIYNRMGLSTSQPAIGRVLAGAPTQTIQDFVFVGGGLSTTELDASWATYSGISGLKLGRSILGFPVEGGPMDASAKVWDLTTVSSLAGSVSANVTPFEAYRGSNMAQRVYFADRGTLVTGGGGNVWALGQTTADATTKLRTDSGAISNWNLRKVFHAQDGRVISTAPTPFTMEAQLPVTRTDVTPNFNPTAVGVIVTTGDRNNPLDNDTTNQPIPSGASGSGYNELAVIFDRQDSSYVYSDTTGAQISTTSTSSNLTDLSSVTSLTDSRIVPGQSGYYLDAATHVGYYLTFPTGSTQPKSGTSAPYFYAKGINNPSLIAGVMFFSIFQPTGAIDTSSCATQATTSTFRICNVLAPVYSNGATTAGAFDANQANCSGRTGQFANLAGEITALGTTLVIQGGQATVTVDGVTSATPEPGTGLQGYQGNPARLGFRPRSWRIIR